MPAVRTRLFGIAVDASLLEHDRRLLLCDLGTHDGVRLNALMLEQLAVRVLLGLALLQLGCAVDARYGGGGAGSGHLEWLLHLRLLLQLVNGLHDDVVEARALDDFSLGEAGHFVVIVVPLEKFLGRVAP